MARPSLDEHQFEIEDSEDVEKGDLLSQHPEATTSDKPQWYIPPAEPRRKITPVMTVIGIALLFLSGFGVAHVAVSFTRYGHDLKVNGALEPSWLASDANSDPVHQRWLWISIGGDGAGLRSIAALERAPSRSAGRQMGFHG